jgi:hypothetical protein
MGEKLNLHVQHCDTVLFKKSVINMDIILYDKVPDQIKLREIFNLFKEDLKSFLESHSFYSAVKFTSFSIFSICFHLIF